MTFHCLILQDLSKKCFNSIFQNSGLMLKVDTRRVSEIMIQIVGYLCMSVAVPDNVENVNFASWISIDIKRSFCCTKE